MLGLQHLDVPHLRGRFEIGKGPGEATEEDEKIKTWRDKEENGVEPSEEVGMSSDGGRVKKDRADGKKKAETRTWYDVVKGLRIEDELETANLERVETNRRQPVQSKCSIRETESTKDQTDAKTTEVDIDSKEPDGLTSTKVTTSKELRWAC